MKGVSLGARARPELRRPGRARGLGMGFFGPGPGRGCKVSGGMLTDELSSTRQVQARNRGPHPRPLTLEDRHLSLQTVTHPASLSVCTSFVLLSP